MDIKLYSNSSYALLRVVRCCQQRPFRVVSTAFSAAAHYYFAGWQQLLGAYGEALETFAQWQSQFLGQLLVRLYCDAYSDRFYRTDAIQKLSYGLAVGAKDRAPPPLL
jgi:hypothetical protein